MTNFEVFAYGGIAFLFYLVCYLSRELLIAHRVHKAAIEEIDRGRKAYDKLALEVRAVNFLTSMPAAPTPLPELHTPEQVESLYRRRWHDNKQSVDKALKWDDSAKDGAA